MILPAAGASDFVVEDGILTAYTGTASKVVIPGNVHSIGEGVFEGNTAITSVSFPNHITSIGMRAFYGCTNLQESTTYDAVTALSILQPNGTKVNGKTLSLTVDKYKTYTIKPTPATASAAVTWKSAKTAVATVTSAGKVTCKSAGTAKITATAKDGSGKTAYINVKCVLPKMTSMAILQPNGTKVNGKTLSLTIGKYKTYTIKPTPAKASPAVTWKSAKTGVATVTTAGKVTCKSAGTSKITATAKDGSGKTAYFNIKCVRPKMTGMSILAPNGTKVNGKTLTLKVGKSATYTIKPVPAAASPAVTWKSAKTGIATVTTAGKVTCKAAGTAKITATAKDGSGKTAYFNMKCTK